MMTSFSGRRSVLCVPGDDRRKIEKALRSGADEVVIDLEDAVAPGRKEDARAGLLHADWGEDPPSIAVRVNAPRTPWCHGDLIAVAGASAPVGSIVLPKTESRADVGFAERMLDGLGADGIAVQALVETAAGVAGLPDIVSARERLGSLVVGYADLAASLGRDSSSDWGWVQQAMLIHGRAAGLAVVDGPYLGVAVDDGFRAAMASAVALGFDAKWVIHPRQIPGVNQAMSPSPATIEKARAVLAAIASAQAAGVGAIRLGDELVDEAMAVAARRVLARTVR